MSRAVRAMVCAWRPAMLAVALACSEPQQPPVRSGATQADSADQVMFGVRTALARDGIRRGELYADTVYLYDQSSRMELKGVRADFHTDAGALQGTLVSREGTYDVPSGVLEARGDVVVTTEDGRRLKTPHLRYLRDAEQVESDSSFVLTAPGSYVEGVGFTADPDLRNINIRRTIRATRGEPVSLPQS